MPTAIGSYRLVRELGRGGMGIVYEALDEATGKRVALKQIHPQLMTSTDQVRRFMREGEAACHIRHPNVVEVYEIGNEDDTPYMVMELLDGITLEELLQMSEQLSAAATIAIMTPVMAAVSAAHAAGVVHRDLKPSNIMLARDQKRALRPQLLDFGVSKLEHHNTSTLTESGALLGTLPYMAPEQVYASQQASALSDQYSLAVIIYECVTGQRPFRAQSGYQLMQAIMTAPLVPPSALVPELAGAWDSVLMRALERDPAARYASVSEFETALTSCSQPQTVKRTTGHNQTLPDSLRTPPAAISGIAPRTNAPLSSRRSRVLAGSALAVVGALLAALNGGTQGSPFAASSEEAAHAIVAPAGANAAMPPLAAATANAAAGIAELAGAARSAAGAPEQQKVGDGASIAAAHGSNAVPAGSERAGVALQGAAQMPTVTGASAAAEYPSLRAPSAAPSSAPAQQTAANEPDVNLPRGERSARRNAQPRSDIATNNDRQRDAAQREPTQEPANNARTTSSTARPRTKGAAQANDQETSVQLGANGAPILE